MKFKLPSFDIFKNKDLIYSYIIGIGIVIMTIHIQSYYIAEIFIGLGYVATVLMPLIYITTLKKNELNLGSKWLWIPLLVIVLSVIGRAIYAFFINDSIWGMKAEWASCAYALSLFALYIASRKLGTKIFNVFTIMTIIVATTMPIFTLAGYIIHNDLYKTGGLISVSNYDMAAGFLIIGTLVSAIQKRWWLSAIAIFGLFFTGAEEGLVAIGILFLTIIIRRDFSKKILLPIATLILVTLICFPIGVTQALWQSTYHRISYAYQAITMNEETVETEVITHFNPSTISEDKEIETREFTKDELFNHATGYRLETYWKINPLKPFGYGYNINNFYYGIPHNMILIIVEQIGIIAAIAWMIVCGYGVFKTKWKYVWIGFLSLGIFDHYLWTMAAPWFWVLAGVSSSDKIENDYIFKE